MADDSQLEYEDGAEPEEKTTTEPEIAVESGGSDLPIKAGAVYGAATFLLGYVVTYAIISATQTVTASEVGSAEPGTWKQAGYAFLGHQGVEVQIDGEAAMLSEVMTVGNADLLLMLLPIAALVAAGYSLAKYADGDALEDKLKASVTLVPGYLGLALVTTFLVGHEYGDDAAFAGEAALATQDAILSAGIMWPVVFGLIGALLATWPKPVDRVVAKLG